MNVLDMMRKEFNVDDKRTYLMGHSMGGAGTLYLGSKYASNWAAIAAMAPAAFRMAPNSSAILQPLKDKEVPGATHGSVIEASIPDVFAFFRAHTK